MKRFGWLLMLLFWLGLGFAQLGFQTDPLDLLPGDLDAVRGLKWQQERLINPDETLITISSPAEEAAAAAESLAVYLRSQPEVGDSSWQRNLTNSAAFVSDLTAYLWLHGDPQEFAALMDRFEPGALKDQLQTVTERLAVTFSPEEIARLSFDPCGLLEMSSAKRFFSAQSMDPFRSADGTFRIVRVNPKDSLPDHWACIGWIKHVRGHLVNWREENPEHAAAIGAITGRPSFVAESASSMERDMERAIPMTAFLVGMLFWLAHRRWRPVAVLVLLLTGVLVLTVAAGGLIFGTLHAISLGFAAILLGVCADYALVLYGEYRASGDQALAGRAANHGIKWSAITTAVAFAALVLGGLPGLGQLGLLVAVGVLIGAEVFVRVFLRRVGPMEQSESTATAFSSTAFRMALGCLLFGVLAVLAGRGAPGFTTDGRALQSPDSEAMAGVSEISKRMVGNADGWLVFVSADDGDDLIHRRLERLEEKLDELKESGSIDGYLLPSEIVPHFGHLSQNMEAMKEFLARTNEIERVVADAGFGEEALGLQRDVFGRWGSRQSMLASEEGRGIQRQATWVDGRGRIVAGWLDPADGAHGLAAGLSSLDGVMVASWGLLGESIWARVTERMHLLLCVLCPLVLVSLYFALGRLFSVLMCVTALALGIGILLSVMTLSGWQWNIINVAALPVLLGLGVDFSIHLLLSRRRHEGLLGRTWESTGKAILLCAATSVAAFGSLALASNPVLAEFGRVCFVGVIAMWLAANLVVFSGIGSDEPQSISGPSGSYGASAWRLGLLVIRCVPRWLANLVARILTGAYANLKPDRLAVVTKNLEAIPGARARNLFRNFGSKLVDLWRFEAGSDMSNRFSEWRGWEHIESAQQEGEGILLVTVHLGNWELGSAAIKGKGMDLVVLSNPEPDPRLTEMREAARKRMGTETIIVGEDPFAFVEVIKRLREGAAVALLLDRPAGATATTVELFGRPFNASIGPAELARASGAALLPVVIVEESGYYSAQVLDRIGYDRAKLRDPTERVELTQQLLRAFEPVLQQYPEQWYHFVPIWPES
ncbi:MAG: MMPL family transporter [Limisphaerales bacterium]